MDSRTRTGGGCMIWQPYLTTQYQHGWQITGIGQEVETNISERETDTSKFLDLVVGIPARDIGVSWFRGQPPGRNPVGEVFRLSNGCPIGRFVRIKGAPL